MRTHTASYVAVMVVGLAAFSTVPRIRTPVHQPPEPAARSDGDTIGGVVTGPSGPEAGVWVIAETSELATKFVKIVVTDDQGRYLLPDLPKATYRVWVRAYGLLDRRAGEMRPAGPEGRAGGALPPPPPGPRGIERNGVIPEWAWADPKASRQDEASTARRNPTLNANGSIYGALELSADYLPVLDPVRNTTSRLPLTVRDPNTEPAAGPPTQPSPYWGSEAIWTSKNNVHNPMFDERGRVRSEEHTSELQSQSNLVCRLLLEKKR